MSTGCDRSFEEALLTGYLDGMLTQGDRQRVAVHLEDCQICRRTVEQMRELREATMTTRFATPPDDQWNEAPRGAASRLSFGLGWLVLVVWVVGVTGFALGQLWSSPESLIEKLLVFGGVSGVVLLFLSVLIDRLKTMSSDRYRGVEK